MNLQRLHLIETAPLNSHNNLLQRGHRRGINFVIVPHFRVDSPRSAELGGPWFGL